MTMLMDLRPGVEAALAAQAERQGISLAQYISRLLEAQVSGDGPSALSPTERAALWRQVAADLPRAPLLPDGAMSREAIYDLRG